ncbi:putative inactive heme oxygenase 2, chloroplastic, variant 2 [Sarracenia purpurea var. burkii]
MSYSYSSCASSSATLRGPSREMATNPSLSTRFVYLQSDPNLQLSNLSVKTKVEWNQSKKIMRNGPSIISCCSDFSTSIGSSSSTEAVESATALSPLAGTTATGNAPPLIRKRRRYRKQYPGEKTGITEEMRFVAMRLRNVNGKKIQTDESDEDQDDRTDDTSLDNGGGGGGGRGKTWQPSMEGFLKYLVDSKLVFDTVERIVDESNDVSYAYFRKTGLERSEGLSRDLEWFSQQDIEIPQPSIPGVSYVKYLEELAEKRAPLFLCHFYNIYFSHIAGGQVIAKQVSEKLLQGRELQFYIWEEGNAEELLKELVSR